MRISKEVLQDKILGCWIGKNIGGTIGAPYESRRELLDIQGFASKPGEVIPNDDLDLQLVWLKAMEDRGVLGVDEKVLGEYWLSYIIPHWNEYGTGKSNMRMGLLPPISGEYDNVWKDSNGAWIRSEIWACVNPADPEHATKFGYYDACVDHGMAEGTYAAIFTTAIESAAFAESDIRKLIDIAMSYIPADCKLAKCINMAIEAYDEGVDYVEARQRILDYTLPDIGWFQAPANVAFVVIGLLYGEGDFKKSMIIAVNCGDDTDCTGATLGSLYGIILGASGLPEDWKAYIGDYISVICVDRTSWNNMPWRCDMLTDRTYRLMEQARHAFNRRIPLEIVDEKIETEVSEEELALLMAGDRDKELSQQSGFVTSHDFIHMNVKVDMMRDPVIQPGEEFKVKVKVENLVPEPRFVMLNWILPEGWSVKDAPDNVYLHHESTNTSTVSEFEATIVCGETKQAQNRVILEMVPVNRPTVGLVPLMFL